MLISVEEFRLSGIEFSEGVQFSARNDEEAPTVGLAVTELRCSSCLAPCASSVSMIEIGLAVVNGVTDAGSCLGFFDFCSIW